MKANLLVSQLTVSVSVRLTVPTGSSEKFALNFSTSAAAAAGKAPMTAAMPQSMASVSSTLSTRLKPLLFIHLSPFLHIVVHYIQLYYTLPRKIGKMAYFLIFQSYFRHYAQKERAISFRTLFL